MTHAQKLLQKDTQPTTHILSVLLAFCLAVSAHGATRISQFGITWTFDRDYPSGQFANGDYWVVGPVKITTITPAISSVNGTVMNGSMINPTPNAAQGYDSRIKQNPFSSAANVAARLPLTVQPGSSLLSAESYPAAAKGDNPQLKTIAILTVLAAPAPAGSFRPPYCGSDKSLRWSASQVRYDKLRSLPIVPHSQKPAALAARFDRPWIEQKTNWTGRYMHPGGNQPPYGRDMAQLLGEGLLALQLEYSTAQKAPLAIRLVQYGLDIYGAARMGARWDADGGHNPGRKMPLLLAGVLLGDAAILRYADARTSNIFQEDQQTWYVSARDVGRSLFSADSRPRLPYVSGDIGMPEWGEKHWIDPSRDGRNWDTYYRRIAGNSTIGHVLVAQLMGLQVQWNWPATFDYYDRYWSVERGNISRGSPFLAEMWSGFRDALVANFMETNIATNVWENTKLNDQTKSFTVAFDILASATNISGLTGLSDGNADEEGDLATCVRFAPNGFIDAANGSSYQSASAFRYQAGVQYRVVMTVDLAARRYSVKVAAPGGTAVTIADGWKFRSSASSIDNLGFYSANGYHAVLNVGLAPVGSAPSSSAENNVLEAALDAASQVWQVGG